MNKQNLIYIGIAVLALVLIVGAVVTLNAGSSGNQPATGQVTYKSNTPQECRPPAGQDVQSWKEHLGHHDNTKYCLEYYK